MAIITGDNLANALIGTNLADTISGLAGNDTLVGLAGNDVLNGGLGADTMVGGAGNDVYVVDDIGDVVAEAVNEGTDTIQSSVSQNLNLAGRQDVENLTLTGLLAINGFGNALNNVLIGNAAANLLSGGGGNDSMFGGGGNDTMFGGIGNDTMFGGTGNDLLDGGTGADTMRGEAGDDTYVIDNVGDVVVELAGGGLDTIQSSISLSLNVVGRLDVENLTLTGTAVSGIGNAQNNVINGNGSANILMGLDGNDRLFGFGGNDNMLGGNGNDLLDGGIGADTMRGEAGNDVYVVDNVGDVVIEAAGAGTDSVQSSISFSLNVVNRLDIENLTLTGTATTGVGNALNNVLIGNASNNVLSGLGGNDTLFGLAGNDVLNGGLGADTIVSGIGSDTIVFNTLLGGGNIDTITDFDPAADTIQLENAIFTTLPAGALAGTAFQIGAAAVDASDRIIYNSATGNLFYDPDGFGGVAQVQFARVSAGLAMTSADFVVV